MIVFLIGIVILIIEGLISKFFKKRMKHILDKIRKTTSDIQEVKFKFKFARLSYLRRIFTSFESPVFLFLILWFDENISFSISNIIFLIISILIYVTYVFIEFVEMTKTEKLGDIYQFIKITEFDRTEDVYSLKEKNKRLQAIGMEEVKTATMMSVTQLVIALIVLLS